MKRQDNDVFYVGRLYLFGIIPLWKVKHTKREWQAISVMETKRNKIVIFQFIEDEEKKNDREY